MSKLIETKRAYDRVKAMLNQQLLNRGSDAQEIREAQAAVDIAFYLLGWAQFEYVTRKEAEHRIEVEAAAKTVHGTAWKYVNENIKAFSIRRKLEVIFQGNPATLATLNKDYDLRNEAAHNYRKLPSEARDISAWLGSLEGLVDKY